MAHWICSSILLVATLAFVIELQESIVKADVTPIDCYAHVDCDECTLHETCVWCYDRALCAQGNHEGPKDPSTCLNYTWKQC